jgi:hypothetical protein
MRLVDMAKVRMTLYDNEQVRLTTDLLHCPPPSGASATGRRPFLSI